MRIKFIFALAIIPFAIKSFGQKHNENQGLQEKYRVFQRLISADAINGTLHLNEGEGVGIAWINRETFIYGTIEFDIKGRDLAQRSFVGFCFHGLNDTTYEAIYFRPFNFQSTDPTRKTHAVQYIAAPLYDWPKLREQFPNKYEQPISPAPGPNDWFHVRIVVDASRISVFVNANANPSLVVEPLVPMRGNHIGYWVGNGSDGDWKNLMIKPAK
jgi:hypothetical protein